MVDINKQHAEQVALKEAEIAKLKATLQEHIEASTAEIEKQRMTFTDNQERERQEHADETARLLAKHDAETTAALKLSTDTIAEMKAQHEQKLQQTIEQHRLKHDTEMLAFQTSKEI